MSEQDMNKIRKLAEGHTMTPRPEAWKKLHGKLKSKKAKRRLLVYRNISIAAILISVLSVTVVLSLYLGTHDPKVFSSNNNYSPIIFEELVEFENDPFFDIKYVDQLHDVSYNEKFHVWSKHRGVFKGGIANLEGDDI